jgi:GNAT superfamily N-acetyltransferase
LNLREATPGDVTEINHLRLQVRENQLSDPALVTEAMTIDAICHSGRGWVMEENGRILGFSIALEKSRSIWALFVLPEHEGRGVGHRLHEAAVNWLWSRGTDKIWLGTDPGTRAERFYRDRGWIEAGVHDNGEIRFELQPPVSAE